MQLPTGDNVAASECNKAVCYPSTSQQPDLSQGQDSSPDSALPIT